ncbi:DUF1656 domain-containing protein [Brucellaceae bacterium C25G]
MTGQLDIYGIFFPSIIITGTLTYFLFRMIQSILDRIDFYHLVWHWSLFNTAFYITLLCILSTAFDWY